MPARNPPYRYRGTRPKHSLTQTFNVYCDRCECHYKVPKTKNGDQWLNLHMIRFDCIKKKIIRQREEDDYSNTAGVRNTARSDVAFVLDGVRQEEVEEKVDGDSSDDESVDSATNFDIITDPVTEAFDEETYEDLNESCYGFFSSPFSAEDVGQVYHSNRTEPGSFNTIHMEEISRSGSKEIPSIDVAEPSAKLLDIQLDIIERLGVATERSDFIIRSRSRNVDSTGKKLLADLVDLYEWGLKSGISERKGNELLDVFHGIMGRHETVLPIGHTWKGIKKAIRRKSRGVIQVDEYSYKLPLKFFGTEDSHGKPWLPVKAYALDLKHVLAKALLDVDPTFFATAPKPQTYGLRPDYPDPTLLEHLLQTEQDLNTVEFEDEMEFLLSDFSTGKYFSDLCKDAALYPAIDGQQPFHICLAIFSDKSLATSNSSEQPVVFSILNCLGKEYKMLFLGYAPITLPYSDEALSKELGHRGFRSAKAVDEILSMTKREIVLRYMNDLFAEITSFGKNCFRVQIGRGDAALRKVAFINVSLLGGDNEHLNYVCGTASTCAGRNCRRCMSNRTYRFMLEEEESAIRVDNDHEVLSHRRKMLKTRQLLKVAAGQSYRKSAQEHDLVALGKNLKITKLGFNPLYSRFWYANYRGLAGLHASCPPDWLHTIIKGCVEKTLSGTLLLVELFSKFDYSDIAGGSRCLPWKYNKSILDHRSRFFPIHLFSERFCRLHRFCNGISDMLKVTKKNGHTSTGLLTAHLEAWKLVPALMQLMFSIGHDGVVLPNNDRRWRLSRLFPGVEDPLLQDVSEVVTSASASVLEFVWVVSSEKMVRKDSSVMYYLTSNMQLHQFRLAMLVKILTSFDQSTPFIMPHWRSVLEGDKKHSARHVVDAKIEWGAELRTWDTELAESYWKECLKLPHSLSSKKHSEKRMQMVLYMKDRLCVDELKRSIAAQDHQRRPGQEALHIMKVKVGDRDSTFMVKTVYLVDRLKYSSQHKAWVRLDWKVHYESRFLHCLTDMEQVSDKLNEISSSYPADHNFKASLLQRVEFTSHNLNRKIVLFCDSAFITNVTSETTSRVTLPSFSAIRYMSRIRRNIAPLRMYAKFASYLPYTTLEHEQSGNGVSIDWIEPSDVVDGHFLIPIQGLTNSIAFDKLPPWQSYNTRSGSRLYSSISFEDYDVGNNIWSSTHTPRVYCSILRHDRTPCLVHEDRKVFLSEDRLRELQTDFGFDDDYDADIPYRQAPKKHSDHPSKAMMDTSSQVPITKFFAPVSRNTAPASSGASSSVGGASTSAIESTLEPDSDDEYVSEVDVVNGEQEGDY